MSARRFKRHSAWIGARVREFRIKRKLGLSDLARRLGVRQAQMSKYELGVDRLSFEALVEIADALQVPLDAFRPPLSTLENDRLRRRDPLLARLKSVPVPSSIAELSMIGRDDRPKVS